MGKNIHKLTAKQLKKAREKYPLTVSEETFEAWQQFRRPGDAKRLCEVTGMSFPTNGKILAYGWLKKMELLPLINKFFTDRVEKEEKESKKLLSLANKK